MKYTEVVTDGLAAAISKGLSNRKACHLIGVSEPTFYSWIDTKPEFKKKMEKARAKKVERLLSAIEKHGEKNYKALAFILTHTERSFQRAGYFTEPEEHEPITGFRVIIQDGSGGVDCETEINDPDGSVWEAFKKESEEYKAGKSS